MTGTLHPLRLHGQAPEDADVDFILVGGLGTSPPPNWAIVSSPWLGLYEETGCRLNHFHYDYNVVLDDKFSFQSLPDACRDLLAALSRLQQAETIRPVLFVSHSLGSFVVKQALCVANAQRQTYAKLLNSVLAIAFLGGLHSSSDPALLSEQCIRIIRMSPNRIPKQSFSRLNDEAWLLADICRLFEDIGLHVEVLSLYETEKTRFKVGFGGGKGLFGSHQSAVLVNEDTCRCRLVREQCFPISGDHARLPELRMDNGEPDSRVQKWLRFVLGADYRQTVLRRMNPAPIQNSPTVSMTSFSSYDAARIALSEGGFEVIPQQPPPGSIDASGSNNPTAGSSVDTGWKLVPIIKGFATKRPFAQLPCFMMESPTRNKEFWGRASIMEVLDSVLLPQDKAAASFSPDNVMQKHVVLCGIGGIGKTSIAIEYAFSRKSKFDAVFWIRADEPEKLEQDFGRIASELGLLDTSEPSNPVINRDLAKGWLESPRKALDKDHDIIGQTEAQWLIIFDNADSPDLLQDYWPLSANGSILVTSRDPLSKTSPSIAVHAIDIQPFTDGEAAQLLQHLSRLQRDEEIALKIATKLGGLPLAISQMAAVIRYQYLSFSDFLSRYEDDSDRRELLSYNAVLPRPEARGNIASIWAVEQLEPTARCLLNICAMIDPDCIEERLFTGDISGVQDIESFPRGSFAYSAARANLIKRSLISRNEETKEFRIHRVLQSTLKSKMTPESTLQFFLAAVNIVLTAWGDTPLVQRHVLSLARSRDGLFPHALALRNFYSEYYKDQNPEGCLQFAKLMNESGWYQHERGNSQDIKPFLTLALDICGRNSGPAWTQILSDIHYGLAAAANETNDAKSCLYHTQKLLELRLEAFATTSNGDIRLAIAHNEIAIAWVMNHEYHKAIEQFEASISVYQGLEDYWPGMDTNPRTNMGFTYWVMGDLGKAEHILSELLKDREAKFGIDDKESYRTGRVYHGLGNIAFDQCRFEDSEKWHQRALFQYQETLGNNHHKTADLCHRVAKHCMRNDNTEHARTLINQALKVYSLRKTVYLPELARTTFLRARLEMQLENGDEATSAFKRAKAMRARIHSVPHKPDIALREADFDNLVTFFSR